MTRTTNHNKAAVRVFGQSANRVVCRPYWLPAVGDYIFGG